MTRTIFALMLTTGWRRSSELANATRSSTLLIGAVMLTLWPSPLAASAALLLIGTGYGFISGSTAGAIAHYWPPADYGRVASRIYIAWCAAAVTLPITAIASVYGMNVIVNAQTHYPQLIIVLVIMAAISGALLRWTKKQGWW